MRRAITGFFILLAVGAGSASGTGIVKRCGNKLMLDGKRYLFNGVTYLSNKYGRYDSVYTARWFQRRADTTDANVVRAWIFGHNPVTCHYYPNPSRGVINEEHLVRVDRLISVAEESDMKLILCLGGQWMHGCGVPHLVQWSQTAMDTIVAICQAAARNPDLDDPALTGRTDLTAEYQGVLDALDAATSIYDRGKALEMMKAYACFYDDRECRTIFKEWLYGLITRTNTITGRKYTEEPAILCWEIMNEGRNFCWEPECYMYSTLWEARKKKTLSMLDWYDEMSSYIKELDTNHLVSTGEDGFLNYVGRHNEYGDWLVEEVLGEFMDPVDEVFTERLVDSIFSHIEQEEEREITDWEPFNNNLYSGTDFYLNSTLENIDLLTLHDYPWDVDRARAWRVENMVKLAKEVICKPVYVGETRIEDDTLVAAEFYGLMDRIDIDGLVYWEYPTGLKEGETIEYSARIGEKMVALDEVSDCDCAAVSTVLTRFRAAGTAKADFSAVARSAGVVIVLHKPAERELDVSLVSVSGKTLAAGRIAPGRCSTGLAGSGSGIYMVVVRSAAGCTMRRILRLE